MICGKRAWLAAAVCLLAPLVKVGVAAAGQTADAVSAKRGVIGLIIDDLGDRLTDGRRAIALPGAVTYAILPQTTYSTRLATLAHTAGKEIMLHQPMEAMNGKTMGPGGIDSHMSRGTLITMLSANLDSVPHARGVNNHMGSLLSRQPEHMAWLMEALRAYGGLYFVDSATTSNTIAQRVAAEYKVPNTRRNIFLDHLRETPAILRQFVRLVEQARSTGVSLAIAHPYPETLEVLEKVLPHLDEFGVELVTVSELIVKKERRREELWQASLSH